MSLHEYGNFPLCTTEQRSCYIVTWNYIKNTENTELEMLALTQITVIESNVDKAKGTGAESLLKLIGTERRSSLRLQTV